MRIVREYPRHNGRRTAIMHEDIITTVVEQLGSYHVISEYYEGKDVVERATVTLSRQEMLRIISDFNALEEKIERQLDHVSPLTRGFERLLNITRE